MRGVVAFLLALSVTGAVSGEKVLPGDPRVEVGRESPLSVRPEPASLTRSGDGSWAWSTSVEVAGAAFLKPHFSRFDLPPGAELVVRSGSGRVVETLVGTGPQGLRSFWGLSVFGDRISLDLTLRAPTLTPPFEIDSMIIGDSELLEPVLGPSRAVCGSADFEDVVCYEGDGGKWANVLASVGVMSVGNTPGAPGMSGLWCSGSNIDPLGRVLTNWHCVPDAEPCTNTEFVFRYYRTVCGGGPETSEWVSFRCDEMLADSPFDSCEATISSLDFSLSSVLGEPALDFGAVEPDPNPLTSGESIYIIQHPDGRPHEITHGSGGDVLVDGNNIRYFNTLDTEGGSSGSPIFRESDDLLVGLHHCGGCDTSAGNRGMLVSDILPTIQAHLCQPAVSLEALSSSPLTEVIGDGDGAVEPGESWRFTPSILNLACDETAIGASATFAVAPGSSGGVQLPVATAAFGDVLGARRAGSLAPVVLELDSGVACGSTVTLDLVELTALGAGSFPGESGYLTFVTGRMPQSVVLNEDFNGGIPASWSIVDGGSGGGAAATWTTANPGGRALALTAPFAIVDSDEAGSSATQDEELITPVIDVSEYTHVFLQLTHDFHYYSSGGTEAGDVDVRSTLTGGQWVNVASFSAGDQSGLVSLELTANAAGVSDLQVRFRYHGGAYDWWWAIDDVYVLGEVPYVCDSSPVVFADGFESGTTGSWSHSVP